MSSSVSSEHAFSQRGITITRLRSCLKGDIVEALQCLKCAIRHDLLFQEPALPSLLKGEEIDDQELGDVAIRNALGEEPADEDWDGLIIEDEDEEAVSTMYGSD
jgi:hypothetical protein